MTPTYFSASQTAEMAKPFQGDLIALALSLLPDAAQHAVVPVSHFHVGAIVIDDQGAFYFGANQESSAAMAQTVHAEQSAVSHAWMRNARKIAHVVVNHTPCGHCRQFLNELRGNDTLKIHLPHSRDNLLAAYLPDSFGPANLDMTVRLLDAQQHPLTVINTASKQPEHSDELFQAAFDAAAASYAPYTQAYAGVALQCSDGSVFSGRYAENAAYNPSLPPLQTALNLLRLNGRHASDITAAVLVCTEHGGHQEHTQNLWQHISNSPLAVQTVQAA